MNGQTWNDIAAELATLHPAERLVRFSELFGEGIGLSGETAAGETVDLKDTPPWLRELLAVGWPPLGEADPFFSSDDTDYEAVADGLPVALAVDAPELRRRAEAFAAARGESPEAREDDAFARIRYRGEVADAGELKSRFDLEPILAASDRILRLRHFAHRDRWWQEGTLVSKFLAPRVFSVLEQVCKRLRILVPVEVFCLPSAEVRVAASRYRDNENDFGGCVGVTNAVLNLLDDTELAFLLGRELSRYAFGVQQYDVLLSGEAARGGLTILPPSGESLFLRWQRKVQISLDRAGLVACQDLSAAARALLKSAFALGAKDLNVNVPAILAEIETLRGDLPQLRDAFGGDVMLPIRLKALQIFAGSEKAAKAGFKGVSENLLTDDALAEQINGLMVLARRHPVEKIERAMMDIIACGGVVVLCADRDPSEEEMKILIRILHEHYTDEPESVIPASPEPAELTLSAAIQTLVDHGDQGLKHFIVARLAEVAFADGAIPRPEAERISEIAQRLGLSPENATHAIKSAEATAKIIEIRRFAGFLHSGAPIAVNG